MHLRSLPGILRVSFGICLLYAHGLSSFAQPYTIPVVVHVLHNNGFENISDAQIADGLATLNATFSGGFNEPVAAPFNALQADMQVEFCLATLAPDGTPTTGIERIDVGPGYVGGLPGSYIDQWPPERYLNIWIVPFVDIVQYTQGALTPAEAELEPERDGIMIMHTMFGSIGTGIAMHARSICLMAGRYFNLKLLWEDPTGAGDCGDDGVTDTPATEPIDICFPNLMSCVPGSLTNVDNYMTYSYCGKMFTLGQRDRVHACLQSVVAQRNNLWTSSNLELTGCGISAEIEEQPMVDGLRIFPNPADDQVTISGLRAGPCLIEFMDIAGRTVFHQWKVVDTSGQLHLDLSTDMTDQALRVKTNQNGQIHHAMLIRSCN